MPTNKGKAVRRKAIAGKKPARPVVAEVSCNKTTSNRIKWTFFGEGTFNQVYVTDKKERQLIADCPHKGQWIKKQPKSIRHDKVAINGRKRGVRLFNLMNEDKPEYRARLYGHRSWIASKVPQAKTASGKLKQPTDKQLAEVALKTYLETGRIFWDIAVDGNVLIDKKGELVPVDVDHILRPDSPTSFAYVTQRVMADEPEIHPRARYHIGIKRRYHSDWMAEVKPSHPITTEVITGLERYDFIKDVASLDNQAQLTVENLLEIAALDEALLNANTITDILAESCDALPSSPTSP